MERSASPRDAIKNNTLVHHFHSSQRQMNMLCCRMLQGAMDLHWQAQAVWDTGRRWSMPAPACSGPWLAWLTGKQALAIVDLSIQQEKQQLSLSAVIKDFAWSSCGRQVEGGFNAQEVCVRSCCLLELTDLEQQRQTRSECDLGHHPHCFAWVPLDMQK